MQSGILDNYRVPEIAQEAFRSGRYQPRGVEDGVQVFAGHDTGVAFRFYKHYEYNKAKSKLTGVEQYDTYEMIEWLVNSKFKPTERVHFIGDELLEFNDEGQCVGGRYAESYHRYKQGQSAPGTPLNRWPAAHEGQVATLAQNGIFSVQQLAATDRAKIRTKFPQEFEELLDRAIEHVNGEQGRADSARHAEELLKVHQENSKLKDEMESLREQMKKLVAPEAERTPRKRRSKAEIEAAA